MTTVQRLFILLGLFLASLGCSADEPGPALELRPDRDRIYPEQAVELTVRLNSGSATLRDVGYPQLAGPDGPVPFRPRGVGSQNDDGYEFTGRLVLHSPGKLRLGPAEIRFSVLTPATGAAAVFGGTEARHETLRSQPVELTILPLPARGRPTGYSGAVGRFRFDRDANPRQVLAGDPLTLVTRIEGVGNLDAIACPTEVVSGVNTNSPSVKRGTRLLVCEQVLVPMRVGPLDIPAGSFNYFDPESGRYRSLTTPAISISVLLPETAPSPQPAPALPRADSSPLPHYVWGWVVAAFVLGLLVGLVSWMRRRRSCKTAARSSAAVPAHWLELAEQALTAADVQGFHEAVFRSLQQRGADLGAVPVAGIASAMNCANEASSALVAWLFAECDAVRYGGGARSRVDMERTLKALRHLLDQTRA